MSIGTRFLCQQLLLLGEGDNMDIIATAEVLAGQSIIANNTHNNSNQ
jgi:hypothetical protein